MAAIQAGEDPMLRPDPTAVLPSRFDNRKHPTLAARRLLYVSDRACRCSFGTVNRETLQTRRRMSGRSAIEYNTEPRSVQNATYVIHGFVPAGEKTHALQMCRQNLARRICDAAQPKCYQRGKHNQTISKS
jgi:hypothetical protein